MNKVYLVYYSGWDEYNPDLMVIKTTKEKAKEYISELVAKETWKVDDFHVDKWVVE